MFKKIFINLILKWYVKKNREVHKLLPSDEMQLYLFSNPADYEKVIRAEISARTIRYFEAKSEKERLMIKGEVFALKLLKDKHLFAHKLNNDNSLRGNEELKLSHWNKLR